MILTLGMKHLAMELYKVCITHDHGMTLTYFTARSTKIPHAFEWEKLLKCDLKGKTCRKWANGQKIFVYENILGPRGLSVPTSGLYVCI